MKIIFAGVGNTHYYSLVQNRMASKFSYKIWNVIPKEGEGHFGAGVKKYSGESFFQTISLKDIRYLQANRFFSGLTLHVLKIRPDCIVLTEEYLLSFYLNPLLVIFCKLTGCKIYLKSIPFRLPLYDDYIKSNKFPFSVIKGFLRSFVYKLVDGHLVYVSKGKEVYASYGVDPEKVYVTYNSPDTDSLLSISQKLQSTISRVDNDIIRIVHIGRLIKWKKVDLLIEACAILQKRGFNIELVVVGDGPELSNLKTLSSNYKNLKVVFKGPIHDSILLGSELLKCDLYVLAGIGGLSINDAMSFGLPVICSECDGTEVELVEAGTNGYIFKNDDLNDLVDKIELVISDKNKMKEMGKNSLEIIKNKININTVLDKYKKAFDQCL